ncbi:MAG: hypothetical protein KFB96_24870 [Thiocapsa sp.]|uniref:hypothetical protein n=1 Tax=Thiocapsa sp. TaxID=2024551 RepID=UPI001BD015FE|nr:hypothetical protein [Thiocapsa sp.]QVL48745.1 MAG: hypothetical protein KFB96_24870 [Thiocapsa sp.]
MAAPLVALALDYYRDPLAYRHLAEVERPLPRGFSALLAEFCSALSSARIAQTAAQLVVDPDETGRGCTVLRATCAAESGG